MLYSILAYNFSIIFDTIMQQRNYSIDILKFVCAVLVVFLHTNCAYKDYVLPLTRCAVPCFFMISGYLLYREGGIGVERIKRNFMHVAKITLWATVLFLFWKELTSIRNGVYVPSAKQMLEWIILNKCPFGFHLWYLYAYLYVLMIVLVIDKYLMWRLLFMSIPLLLLTDLVFGKYSLVVFNMEFPYIIVRNFMFVGLPYFALGALLKTKQIPCETNKKKLKYPVGGVILFSITSQLEKFILICIDKCPAREHYISSTFLAISLFILLLSIKVEKPNVMSKIGEKDSLYIYILHPIFIVVLSSGFKIIGLSYIYLWIAPFCVIAGTLAFICFLRISKILK